MGPEFDLWKMMLPFVKYGVLYLVRWLIAEGSVEKLGRMIRRMFLTSKAGQVWMLAGAFLLAFVLSLGHAYRWSDKTIGWVLFIALVMLIWGGYRAVFVGRQERR